MPERNRKPPKRNSLPHEDSQDSERQSPAEDEFTNQTDGDPNEDDNKTSVFFSNSYGSGSF